jgi:transposase
MGQIRAATARHIYQGIATRYEKTALSFAAMLYLVGTMIWLR